MKKFAVIVLALVVSAVTFGSCKSHEKCPAYSKADQTSKQSL